MTDVRVGLEQAAREVSAPSREQHASIAVLPFGNMSRDPDDDYFSDGLAEEITNLLAHVPNFKVTARTSAFAFRGNFPAYEAFLKARHHTGTYLPEAHARAREYCGPEQAVDILRLRP